MPQCKPPDLKRSPDVPIGSLSVRRCGGAPRGLQLIGIRAKHDADAAGLAWFAFDQRISTVNAIWLTWLAQGIKPADRLDAGASPTTP